MIVNTTPGETYAVTVTVPCEICAVTGSSSPFVLVTAQEPGQYLVVAPTAAFYIDDDSALVTRSFKSAPVGTFLRAASSGGSTCSQTVRLPLAPGDGHDNLNTCGFAFTASGGGALQSIAVEGRTGYEFHHNPVWLKLWLAAPGSPPSWLAVSQNSVVQQNGALNTWQFRPGTLLSAGQCLLVTTHRGQERASREFSVDGEEGKLLARVASIPTSQNTGCMDDSAAIA